MEDSELLREFVSSRSEQAFSRLVERHLDLVYATALRVVQEPHLAKDVAQDVFIALAKQPKAIRDASLLPAWLYRTTRFTAAGVVRTERRRREREHRAFESRDSVDRPVCMGERIDEDLDQALESLDPLDQSAIALRFLEGKSLRVVGQALGISDDAAQKRVSRALETLRLFLKRRGIAAEAAVIISALSAAGAQATPPGLSVAITSAALAASTLVSGSGAAISFLIMTKLKSVLVSAAVVAAAVVSFVYQQRKIDQLQGQNADLQRQIDESVTMREEHQRLAKSYSTLESTRQAEQRELLRLRADAAKKENDRRIHMAQVASPTTPAQPREISTAVAGALAEIEARVTTISQAVNVGKLQEMTNAFNEINELCDDLQGKNKNVAPSAEEWNLTPEQYQAALKLIAGMENDAEGLRSIAVHPDANERTTLFHTVWNEQFATRYAKLKALLSQSQLTR